MDLCIYPCRVSKAADGHRNVETAATTEVLCATADGVAVRNIMFTQGGTI
jgi:hypothetical protein